MVNQVLVRTIRTVTVDGEEIPGGSVGEYRGEMPQAETVGVHFGPRRVQLPMDALQLTQPVEVCPITGLPEHVMQGAVDMVRAGEVV